jgi:hypothetical protein
VYDATVMSYLFSVLVFAVALAYRVYINRGQTKGTPDEKLYSIYAHMWRPGEVYRKAVEAFLAKPSLEIPPTRFGFFAVCASFCRGRKDWPQCFRPVTWVAAVSAAFAAPVAYQVTRDLPSSLLVASAPLSLFLSRRALQDSFTGLLLLVGVWAIYLQNVWLLVAATTLALISREALLLYLPSLLLGWGLRTSHWGLGAGALMASTAFALLAFYAAGGRQLMAVLKKLGQPTDYVRRFQSGPPHRLLVDMLLVSPVVTVTALVSWHRAPIWLLAFVGSALAIHSVITPKNIRFLLVVDVGTRMLCAGLPGPWPWIVLALGSVADLWLYRTFGKCEDPVTANLIMKSGMYLES